MSGLQRRRTSCTTVARVRHGNRIRASISGKGGEAEAIGSRARSTLGKLEKSPGKRCVALLHENKQRI
eukprot:1822470-Pleurochrysis_carterae.AAC.2